MLSAPPVHILSYYIRISSTFLLTLLHKSQYGCQCWRLQVYSPEQTRPMGGRLMRLSYHFLLRCTSSQADWVVTWEREEQSTQTHISTPPCTHTYTQTRPCTSCLMVSVESCQAHFLFFYSLFPPSLPLSHLSLSPLTISLHPSFSLSNSMPLQQFATTFLMKETTQHEMSVK